MWVFYLDQNKNKSALYLGSASNFWLIQENVLQIQFPGGIKIYIDPMQSMEALAWLEEHQ